MKYIDIKDKVVEVTHNLETVPFDQVEDYLRDQWELRHHYSVCYLRGKGHPSIKRVVHVMLVYCQRRYYTISSVVVDDVPAFLYIRGGREGTDYHGQYVLNIEAFKAFIKYLAVLAIETRLQDITGFMPEYLPEVSNEDVMGVEDDMYSIAPVHHDTDIPDLDTFILLISRIIKEMEQR